MTSFPGIQRYCVAGPIKRSAAERLHGSSQADRSKPCSYLPRLFRLPNKMPRWLKRAGSLDRLSWALSVVAVPTTLANILDDAETYSMLVKLGVGAGWAIRAAAGGAAGHDSGRIGALVEVSQQCALRCAMGLHEKQVHHSARATLQRDTLICLRVHIAPLTGIQWQRPVASALLLRRANPHMIGSRSGCSPCTLRSNMWAVHALLRAAMGKVFPLHVLGRAACRD